MRYMSELSRKKFLLVPTESWNSPRNLGEVTIDGVVLSLRVTPDKTPEVPRTAPYKGGHRAASAIHGPSRCTSRVTQWNPPPQVRPCRHRPGIG